MKQRPLRRLRQSKGLTLEKLSESAGTSTSHLSGLERGERKASPETIRAILDAIDQAPALDHEAELCADVQTEIDILQAEAALNDAAIAEATAHIRAGIEVETYLRFAAVALRRQRAILTAIKTRLEMRSPS